MAITISGENNNDRITAADGVIDTISGFNISGIITASSFTGDLTGDVTGNLTGNVTGNINNSTLLLQTGGTERLRIESNGRIAVGGFSGASNDLHIKTASSPTIRLEDTTNTCVLLSYAQNSNAHVGTYSNHDLIFDTNSTERLRITSAGEVGIGTVTPESGQLQVIGSGYHQINISGNKTANANKTGGISFLNYEGSRTSVFQTFANNSANTIYYGSADSSARGVQNHIFYVNSSRTATSGHSEALRITSTGNIGIGENSPANLLHVKVSDAGIAPHPSAQIVLERSGTNYLQFLTAANGTSGLLFGDTNDIDVAKIVYDHNIPAMQFQTEGGERLRITSNGRVQINTNGDLYVKGSSYNAKLNGNILEFDRAGYSYIDNIADTGSLNFRVTSSNTIALRLDNAAQAIFPQGVIHLGTQDSSSGHLNAYEVMTFNIDTDNDDTTRYFAFYKNGANGSGTELLRITEGGKVSLGTAPASSPPAFLHVKGNDYQTLRLENYDGGSNGPYIELYNNSASPADNDYTGIISFKNRNSANEEITYTQIRSQSTDVTDGTEDGVLTFHTRGNGTFGERLRIDSSGRVLIGNSSTNTQKIGDGTLQVFTSDRKHPAIRTNAGNANGYTMFSDAYQADESQVNIGISYSSAKLVFSTSVKPSDTADNTYLSSQDSFSARPCALTMDHQGVLSFLNTSTSATTTTDSAVSLTERLRITNDGKVVAGGSGTGYPCRLQSHGPGNLLDLNSTSGAAKILFYESGAGRFNIETLSGSSGLRFYDSLNAAERLRIASTGRVGINVTNPYNMIEVKNNSLVAHPASFRMIGAHQYASAIMDNDGANGGGSCTFISHRISNSIKGDITFNGSVMVYGGQSDYRLKENVVSLNDGIAKVKQLNPLRYNFINNPDHICEGFFAHEAQAVCPQSTTGAKDDIATEDIGTAIKKGDPVYQQMDYSKLVPLLTAALQEAITKIETLESKVATLEGS